jgi:hypothetical protein
MIGNLDKINRKRIELKLNELPYNNLIIKLPEKYTIKIKINEDIIDNRKNNLILELLISIIT